MGQSFQVIVNSFVHSPGEWRRILEADTAGDIQALAEDERQVAKKLGVEEEGVADKIRSGEYGELRLKAKGLDLGEQAQAILGGLGPQYRLVAVLWENSKSRWMLKVKSIADKIADISIPAELADDVVETRSEQDLERLKNLVLFGVGRQDLIFQR